MVRARKLPVVLLRQKVEPFFGKETGLLGTIGNALTHALGIHGQETTTISADAVEQTQRWLAESMREAMCFQNANAHSQGNGNNQRPNNTGFNYCNSGYENRGRHNI